jgi:flagellar biosynthesis protein FlhB
MSEPGGERIHPPTPRRRQQARQQGRVARSRELVATGVLLAAAAGTWMLGGDVVRLLHDLAVEHFGQAWLVADQQIAATVGRSLLERVAAVLLPLLGCLLLAAIVAQVAQFGLLFLPARIAPDVARVDPLAGCQRLLSAENWLRTALGAAKLAAVLLVAGWSVWALRYQLLTLGAGDPGSLASSAVQILGSVAGRTLLALLALAAADYAWQRRRHERSLWMTAQEMREELRDEQTDPLVSRRRSRLQQQMLERQVSRDVPHADLVIIAGASLAVAVKYDPQTMPAPQVVAKGLGRLAVEIHRVGQQHGIWTVDDRKLARDLYRRAPRSGDVPPDMYPAMAATLAELPRYRDGGVPGGANACHG